MRINSVVIAFVAALSIASVYLVEQDAHAQLRDAGFRVGRDFRYNQFDVKYGYEPGQNMDIYYPLNGSRYPRLIVILIHGGGWVAGDKKDYGPTALTIQKEFKNVLVVSMNYRLSTPTSPAMPKQLDDIEMALNYVDLHPKVNSDPIVLSGSSAGAYLALQYSLTRDKDKRVNGVIAGSCVYDFLDTTYRSMDTYKLHMAALFGKDTAQLSYQLLKEYSPVHHVWYNSPPMFLFSGSRDELFSGRQVTQMSEALRKVRVKHVAKIYGGERHGFSEKKNIEDIVEKYNMFLSWFIVPDSLKQYLTFQ